MVELDKEGTAQHGTTRLEVDFLAGEKGGGGWRFFFSILPCVLDRHRLTFAFSFFSAEIGKAEGQREAQGGKREAGKRLWGEQRQSFLGGKYTRTHAQSHSFLDLD